MCVFVCALYTYNMCLQAAENRHSDFNVVARTAHSNVDGVATIRDDTVLYSTVTSGGTNVVYDGIVSYPVYAVLEQETVYDMYQYVPSKVGHPNNNVLCACYIVGEHVNEFIFSGCLVIH